MIPDYLANDRALLCPRDACVRKLYQPGQPLQVNYHTSYIYLGGFTAESDPFLVSTGSRKHIGDEPNWGPLCHDRGRDFHDFRVNTLGLGGQVTPVEVPPTSLTTAYTWSSTWNVRCGRDRDSSRKPLP